MTSPYALTRLLRRPAILLLLFPVTLGAVSAFVGPGPWFATGDAGGDFGNIPALAAWRLVLVLPLMIGVVVSIMAKEAQHTTMTWTLPRYRSGIFAGQLIIGGIVSTAIVIGIGGFRGARVGLGALGVSALCFAVGSFLADPLTPKWQRRSTLILLAVVAIRAEYAYLAADVLPYVVATLGIAAAYGLLRREHSPDAARRRPLVAAMASGISNSSSLRVYWAGRATSDREWKSPLWRASIFAWVRAAHYEAFGARHGGYPRLLLTTFLIIGTFAFFLGSPIMAAYIPMIGFSMSGFQLRGNLLYPLSRRGRAAVHYLTSLADITPISFLAAVTVAVIYALGPKLDSHEEQTFAQAIPLVFFLVAWAPVAQFAKVFGPVTEAPTATGWFKVFVPMLGWLSMAMLSHKFFGDHDLFRSLPLSAQLGLISVFAVGTQVVYWIALAWYHDTRDLVQPR